MLGGDRRPVFSKRAVLGPAVGAQDAGRDQRVVDHAQGLEVAGVGQVLGPQQVAGGRNEGHEGQYRAPLIPTGGGCVRTLQPATRTRKAHRCQPPRPSPITPTRRTSPTRSRRTATARSAAWSGSTASVRTSS